MFDAIILAGGGARRMDGADKPAVEIQGRRLLDRVIDAVHGAERVVVVGPQRPTAHAVTWTREEPPSGGPVAAIAAGLDEVREAYCVVLAADLPDVGPAVPVLLTAVATADVAVLECAGRPNYLVAAWRTDALRDAIASLESVPGSATKTLFHGRTVTNVPDQDNWGFDCDTWDDVDRARGLRG